MKFGKRYGEFHLDNDLSEDNFRNYYRMNKAEFNKIHSLKGDDILKEGTNMRNSIISMERLVFLK